MSSVAEAPAPARARTARSGTRPRREPLLLAAVVLLQALLSGWFAARSYWHSDDFAILQDADQGGYTIGYLLSENIVHFSPAHRLVTLVLHDVATFDFGAALAVLLVTQAVGTILVQRIVRWFAGPVWWSYVLPFAYGASVLLLPSLIWFSAGLLVLPPATLTLAAIHGYLCWRSSGRWPWLAWSVVAVGGALMFYEKAALVPVYLVLLRVLLLDQDRPLAANVRAALREWRTWAPYAAVGVLWLIAYRTRPYADDWEFGRLSENLTFLRIGWAETFVPGFLGVRLTGAEAAAVRVPIVLAGQVLVLAAIALTVLRRRAAWRAWAFLAIAFLLNMGLLFARVVDWTPEQAGHTARYQTEMVLLTPLVLAAAIGGARHAAQATRRHLLPAAAVLLVFGAVTATSASAVLDDWPAERSKRYLTNLQDDLDALQAGGEVPNLLDERMPQWLVPAWIQPGIDSLSANVRLFDRDVRFNAVADPTYRVGPDGRLGVVRFDRHVGGDPRALLASGRLAVTGARPEPAGRGLCVRAGEEPALLELEPARPLRGSPAYLRASYTTDPGMGVLLSVDRGLGATDAADRGLPPAPRPRDALVELGALPEGPPTFAGLTALVPSGRRTCFTRLDVGAFATVRPAVASGGGR